MSNKFQNIINEVKVQGFKTSREAIKWCLQQGVDFSSFEFQKHFADELGYRYKTIQKMVLKLRKADKNPVKTKTIYTNKTKKKIATKYTVGKSGYVIRTEKGDIHLSIEKADDIFFDFSVHGLDLSSTQVINKHRLQPWE